MTALSVWWRRNFGHRNDPPAMLPDKVTWTTYTAVDPAVFVARMNETETHHGYAWSIDGVMNDDHRGYRVRLIRQDGAYRYRDDGMRGF